MVEDPTPLGDPNPFLRFRWRLDSYDAVRRGRISDEQFVEVVGRLDAAVAAVDGRGFVTTPVIDGAAIAAAAGLDVDLSVKVEVDGVGGSHKARHLMGVAIHLALADELGDGLPERLAIASCGNAAIGAAVVARALDRPIEVYVPEWADAATVHVLDDLGAAISRCPRRPGESGDPCHLRFGEAVADGATPFSVQGTDTPTTLDGGRTLGWELAEQVPDLDAVYVQVGGGALAASVGLALPSVRLVPVQSEGCAPLARAWERLGPDVDFAAAERAPERFMWAWDDPHSAATGILDDVTYDWIEVLRRTHASGGAPVVAPEHRILEAHDLARQHTDVPVCVTGTAGLAGLLTAPPPAGEKVAVLFTGVDRSDPRAGRHHQG